MTKITLDYLRRLIDEINMAGPVPSARTINVNGTTYDLSANRTFTVTDANLSTSDVTTNDVSITKHGFVPKAPNDTTKFLRGDGTWAVPPGGGGINDGDTLSTGLTFPNIGLHILDTDDSHDLILKPGSNLTADRTLTITTGDSDRALTMSGNADISGTNTGDNATNTTSNTYADGKVSDTAYGSGWNGVTTVAPSKNAIYDEVESRFSRKINGVLFNGTADIGVDDSISLYAAMGGVIVCNPIFGDISKLTTNVGLSNQQLKLTAYWLQKGQTITGVKFFQVTQGDYTSNNNNKVGICSYSGGTLTLEKSSADDGTLWKGTSNTWVTKAFSSAFTAPSAGLYFAYALYCRSAQVTQPVILGYTTALAAAMGGDFTNSGRLNAILAGQTNLPSSLALSTTTLNGSAPGLFFY